MSWVVRGKGCTNNFRLGPRRSLFWAEYIAMRLSPNGIVALRRLRATISTKCPAGTFSATGWTSAWPCAPCPVGRYSTEVGATGCPSTCPPSIPYSNPGTPSVAGCAKCPTNCGAGGFGAQLCPASANWRPWPPIGSNGSSSARGSCVTLMATPRTWAGANVSCSGLGTGAHLLTARQVRRGRLWWSVR